MGNIPYEATEEKLKDIFSEVGPVLSLKLVFDRESGKPKGYGFCEYKDQETALSAMRNLNGYEIGGRTLRVDNACTEKSRMEMAALLQGPQVENPYGEHCDPDQAPEIITKTVASLPPEKMYELMKQMKVCIQNNPSEAREMLIRNPQLSYALLQAQVVMRIVDPATAVTFLYKANQVPPVLTTSSIQTAGVASMMSVNNPLPVPAPQIQPFGPGADVDLRPVDPRLARNPVIPSLMNPIMTQASMDMDMRQMPLVPGMDLNFPARSAPVIPAAPQRPLQPSFPSDPRQRPTDPRQKTVPSAIPAPPTLQRGNSIIPDSASDAEKAALIMQVLQLSDEQISMLPAEQRTSILVLKEQIAKSTAQR